MKDQNGRTPLSWAAGKGYEATVTLLLETDKANPNLRDVNSWTLLSWLAKKQHHEVVVESLLETRSKWLKDMDSLAILLWAIKTGNEAVVKVLVETGKV
jgi:ankyrin repeat protein